MLCLWIFGRQGKNPAIQRLGQALHPGRFYFLYFPPCSEELGLQEGRGLDRHSVAVAGVPGCLFEVFLVNRGWGKDGRH